MESKPADIKKDHIPMTGCQGLLERLLHCPISEVIRN
jgi:hypothetical protein